MQVAALGVLVDLAGGPVGGLIGSGWVVVLRTLSALEALQVCHTPHASQVCIQKSPITNRSVARCCRGSH